MEDTIAQRPDRQGLFDIASEQYGYFTAEQASRSGYAPNVLTYHAQRGTFQRVHHGLYRFRDFPFSPREDVVAAWLAVGKDVAVVSHETALGLWDLSGESAAADADFHRIPDIDLGDHFEFIVQRIELAEEEKEAGGAGLRYRVQAALAGRVFEQVLIDVGLVSPAIQPDVVTGPDILDFAGLELVHVPTLPLTLHVAEKVHAYTRRYGPRRAPSAHPKDLIDLALIAEHEPFVASDLRTALDATFLSRATHSLPAELPPPPAAWTRPYAELARRVGIALRLADGYEQARTFLDPVLNATAIEDACWDAASQRWLP